MACHRYSGRNTSTIGLILALAVIWTAGAARTGAPSEVDSDHHHSKPTNFNLMRSLQEEDVCCYPANEPDCSEER
jgi:hypothetical protein